MFYVAYELNGRCSIFDTDDWSAEFYANEEVLEYSKQVKIHGVSDGKVEQFNVNAYMDAIMARDKMHGIESQYKADAHGRIDLVYLKLPRKMTYRVADGVHSLHISGQKASFGVIDNDCEFSLILPKSCKTLDSCCLMNSNISAINLDYVTKIGEDALKGCKQLRVVDLSTKQDDRFKQHIFQNKNMSLYLNATCFAGSGLEAINLGDFPILEKGCCKDCNQLKTVIARSVKEVRYGAFQGCSSLETVRFGRPLVDVSQDAFNGCASLVNIDMPRIKTLKRGAFQGCTSLKTANLVNLRMKAFDDGLVDHGTFDSVFKDCGMLDEIIVSKKHLNPERLGDIYSICKELRVV